MVPHQPASTTEKTTWVIICRDTTGKAYSEYVEGTELVRDAAAGVLRILDGGRLVREYTSGAWSNFCEWVMSYTDFFSGNVIRLSATDDAVERNRPDPQRALATAMAMDTGSAMALLTGRSGTFPKPRRSSESDGVVRSPARQPGPRHA